VKPYYDDGNGIVIYHGDCREILPTLPKVDLVLTDPPYPKEYDHVWDALAGASVAMKDGAHLLTLARSLLPSLSSIGKTNSSKTLVFLPPADPPPEGDVCQRPGQSGSDVGSRRAIGRSRPEAPVYPTRRWVSGRQGRR